MQNKTKTKSKQVLYIIHQNYFPAAPYVHSFFLVQTENRFTGHFTTPFTSTPAVQDKKSRNSSIYNFLAKKLQLAKKYSSNFSILKAFREQIRFLLNLDPLGLAFK